MLDKTHIILPNPPYPEHSCGGTLLPILNVVKYKTGPRDTMAMMAGALPEGSICLSSEPRVFWKCSKCKEEIE